MRACVQSTLPAANSLIFRSCPQRLPVVYHWVGGHCTTAKKPTDSWDMYMACEKVGTVAVATHSSKATNAGVPVPALQASMAACHSGPQAGKEAASATRAPRSSASRCAKSRMTSAACTTKRASALAGCRCHPRTGRRVSLHDDRFQIWRGTTCGLITKSLRHPKQAITDWLTHESCAALGWTSNRLAVGMTAICTP